MIYHEPVLLNESINGLNIRPEGIYVDLTYGGGGHSGGILEKLGKKGMLLAFDQDQDACLNKINDPRLTLINANFRFLRNFLKYHGIEQIHGVIGDLGISSHQVDMAERGFSFMKDGVLDMRMNKGLLKTAADVVNEYDADGLMEVFIRFGELRNAKSIVSGIIEMRKKKRIGSTMDLVDGLSGLLPFRNRNKMLAQIFQSLRMEVNDESGSLKEMLGQLTELVVGGGRLVFLCYHSIEDRLVKNFMKTGNTEGLLERDFFGRSKVPFRMINRNIIVPSEEEIRSNPRARSARLRIAERLET
jgi:16S rRNA (cytosine1402-N4)-methyltransferase